MRVCPSRDVTDDMCDVSGRGLPNSSTHTIRYIDVLRWRYPYELRWLDDIIAPIHSINHTTKAYKPYGGYIPDDLYTSKTKDRHCLRIIAQGPTPVLMMNSLLLSEMYPTSLSIDSFPGSYLNVLHQSSCLQVLIL